MLLGRDRMRLFIKETKEHVTLHGKMPSVHLDQD